MFYSDVVLQHAFRHCNNQNYNKRGGSALKMYNLSKKKNYIERERGREKEKSEEYLSCWLPLVKFINNIFYLKR